MSWQDLIFTIGSVIFIVGLLPSVFGPEKPSPKTSILTGSTLMVFACTYLSMHFWFSALTTFGTASLWMVLFIQRVMEKQYGPHSS